MNAITVAAVALVAVAALRAPAAPAESNAVPACPDLTPVPGLGDACRRDDGLIEIWTADDRRLGTTHGPDPAPTEGTSLPRRPDALRDPACVAGAQGEHYALVIFARAVDAPDTYAVHAPVIRDLVREANAWVNAAAAPDRHTADLRVRCDGNAITVVHAVLPTPKRSAHFGTIVNDLWNMGYRDARVKYWIWYDDPAACPCGGVAFLYGDDRATPDNLNNAGPGAGPLYSATFGYYSSLIMLHELGHNMGAVQSTARHSSQAYHCIDGHDVMCYADGGRTSGWYTDHRCPATEWDCGRDDYFSTAPASTSYLASHWNIGATYNRFVQVWPPH